MSQIHRGLVWRAVVLEKNRGLRIDAIRRDVPRASKQKRHAMQMGVIAADEVVDFFDLETHAAPF